MRVKNLMKSSKRRPKDKRSTSFTLEIPGVFDVLPRNEILNAVKEKTEK